MDRLEKVRKRDGRVVPFDRSKIASAIFRAAQAVGGEDRSPADELAGLVTLLLEKQYAGRIPAIEEIQDMVEKVLIETGHAKTAKAYILYRDRHTRLRERTRPERGASGRAAGEGLRTIAPRALRAETPWDRSRIAEALAREADLDPETAEEVAAAVERRVLSLGVREITTTLVRELVDGELLARGLGQTVIRQTALGIPKHDLRAILFGDPKSGETPASDAASAEGEIAATILHQYALEEFHSPEVVAAHREGRLRAGNLDHPLHVDSSTFVPAFRTASARVLTTAVAAMLAQERRRVTGSLGIAFTNVFYAPLLERLEEGDIAVEAESLLGACLAHADTAPVELHLFASVPLAMRDRPVPEGFGRVAGRRYGEFESELRRFARLLLCARSAAASAGLRELALPRLMLHLTGDDFADDAARRLIEEAALTPGLRFLLERNAGRPVFCQRLDPESTVEPPTEDAKVVGALRVELDLARAAEEVREAGDPAGARMKLLRRAGELVGLAVRAVRERQVVLERTNPGLVRHRPAGLLVPTGLFEAARALRRDAPDDPEELFRETLDLAHLLAELARDAERENGVRLLVGPPGAWPAALPPRQRVSLEGRFHAILPADATVRLALEEVEPGAEFVELVEWAFTGSRAVGMELTEP